MEHLLSCNRKNPGKMKIIITPIVIPLKSFNVLNSFMKTASPIANMKKTIVDESPMNDFFVFRQVEPTLS